MKQLYAAQNQLSWSNMGIPTKEIGLAEIPGMRIGGEPIFTDHRGNIQTLWRSVDGVYVEDKVARSTKHVLRGLHGDQCTGKLISCLYGAVHFVVVDARANSSTYGRWASTVLDDQSRRQVFVPPGVLNGHLCITDECLFWYKLTSPYAGPESQETVRWDDQELDILWPITDPILSLRDNLSCTPFSLLPRWEL